MSLQPMRQQHGSKSLSSAFPCGASSNSSSRIARSFRWDLPACLLTRAQGKDYVPDQPFTAGLQTQSRGSFGVVPLLRVLDLFPTGRSPLEVTQRQFVLSCRAPLHAILSFVHVASVRSRRVSGTFTWRVSDLIRVCGRYFFYVPYHRLWLLEA